MIDSIRRMIQPLKTRISLMIGQAIVTYVRNSENTQKLTLSLLSGEILDYVKRLQPYGMETYPFTDAEALSLFLGGNRSQGIVIQVGDRRYRITDLVEGEVALYTDEDSDTEGFPGAIAGDFNPEVSRTYDHVGLRIHLKRDKIIEILAMITRLTSGKELVITSPLFQVDTGLGVINGDVRINGHLKVSGEVEDSMSSMRNMRNIYNAHGHPDTGLTPKM